MSNALHRLQRVVPQAARCLLFSCDGGAGSERVQISTDDASSGARTECERYLLGAAGPISVEGVRVTAAPAYESGANSCGVTLVAKLHSHPAKRVDGTASLPRPLAFSVPRSILVTAGATRNGEAQLQSLQNHYPLGRKRQ